MKKQDLSWAWKDTNNHYFEKQKKQKKEKGPNHEKKEFFQSREWLKLRYRVLRKYGACCMCCGAKGSRENPVHVDHIKPRSLHPKLAMEFSNLQILCNDCNLGKGNWDETDWRLPDGAEQHMKAIIG